MPQLYTRHSPDHLLVGAGVLYLGIVENGVKNPWRHVGNVTTLELSTANTRIQKFSSMTRGRPLLKSALQRRVVTVRIVMDYFMPENLALHMQGKLDITSQAATPVTGEVIVANVPATPTATLGYQLGGASFRGAALGPLNGLVVKLGATTLTEGTDYEVDDNGEMVTILPGSTAVTNGTNDLTIDYTPTAYTRVVRVRGGSEGDIEVAGLFKPDPSVGPRWEVEWWRGSVSPDGALGFISEEFGNLTLSVELQDDGAGIYGGSQDFRTHMATLIGEGAINS